MLVKGVKAMGIDILLLFLLLYDRGRIPNSFVPEELFSPFFPGPPYTALSTLGPAVIM
jgi:hypothetical protein